MLLYKDHSKELVLLCLVIFVLSSLVRNDSFLLFYLHFIGLCLNCLTINPMR